MIHCPNREMFKNERALTRENNTKATHTRISWDSVLQTQGKQVIGFIHIGIVTDMHARKRERQEKLDD